MVTDHSEARLTLPPTSAHPCFFARGAMPREIRRARWPARARPAGTAGGTLRSDRIPCSMARHLEPHPGRLDGHDQGEGRALAELAPHLHLAAVGLDVALDDRESQARAAVLARGGRVRLEEGLEDLALQLERDADPVVGDRDLEVPGAAEGAGLRGRTLRGPGPDHDLAPGGRELHRVGKEVHHALAGLVAVHGEALFGAG